MGTASQVPAKPKIRWSQQFEDDLHWLEVSATMAAMTYGGFHRWLLGVLRSLPDEALTDTLVEQGPLSESIPLPVRYLSLNRYLRPRRNTYIGYVRRASDGYNGFVYAHYFRTHDRSRTDDCNAEQCEELYSCDATVDFQLVDKLTEPLHSFRIDKFLEFIHKYL